MKQIYDKPSILVVEVCKTDVLSVSGEGLGSENFDKNWLVPFGQN